MRTLTCLALACCCLLTALPVRALAQDSAPAEMAPASVQIPLDGTLRFVIQPTILGLVPPRGAEGYGEVFVRIVQAALNVTIGHYEIKEEVPVTLDAATSQPPAGVETRIRRGEFWAQGIEDSAALLPPLYWGDGELVTNSGLLWLSAASFEQLSTSGSCPIALRDTGYVESAAAGELQSAVDELVRDRGLADDAGFTLDLVEELQYPCVVNGERARIDALFARDSLGLAEYWVLNDPANPLVVKLTYTLGDAGQRDDLSFVRKGGGYAVTSIDFTP